MKSLLPKKKFAQTISFSKLILEEGKVNTKLRDFFHPHLLRPTTPPKPIRKEEQFSEQETFCNRIKNEGLSTRLAAQQPRARPPPNSGDLLIRSLLGNMLRNMKERRNKKVPFWSGIVRPSLYCSEHKIRSVNRKRKQREKLKRHFGANFLRWEFTKKKLVPPIKK